VLLGWTSLPICSVETLFRVPRAIDDTHLLRSFAMRCPSLTLESKNTSLVRPSSQPSLIFPFQESDIAAKKSIVSVPPSTLLGALSLLFFLDGQTMLSIVDGLFFLPDPFGRWT
jgi:hypothetical protein